MRVLRISHSATVPAWRGRERALRADGVDVTLAAARRWHAGGAPVVVDASEDDPVVGTATVGRHPALFLYDPRPLWRLLGERWDVIDVHEEPFALCTAEILLLRALRGNRAPYTLYTAQNLHKRYPFPFGWFERRALRGASGISACNAEAARIAETKGFPGRAQVIPLGVDVDGVEPEPEPAPEAGIRAPITVGMLGRLVPEKGVFVLLDALREQPTLRARIAGAGPLAAEMLALAAARGVSDRVEILGPISPDRVTEFYRSVDVLAVPSMATPRWTEQFGRVAVEAMALGVPVVSSDAGALPDLVGGAGIVVPAGDARRLGEALLDAATESRGRLIIAGRSRARECSWDAVAAAYRTLYARARHPSPPQATQGGGSSAAEDSVEVIVVAYGAPDLLRRALTPVRDLPVTVIDNSSLPDIAELCLEMGVRYVDPGKNLGFGAAVNRALADRRLPGADVLLLNPDAQIDTAGVATLHGALRADPQLASVGPLQVDEDGHPARVEWRFPSPGRAWLEAVGLARLARGPGFVIGSVLLLRAEALDHVGEFDERFFLYAEETDWAYRAHLLGWRHRAVPHVRAVHTGAGTSTDPRRREAFFHASQERYYRKHFGPAGWAIARAAQWTGSTVRALILSGERGREARRRAALYRLGPAHIERRYRSAG